MNAEEGSDYSAFLFISLVNNLFYLSTEYRHCCDVGEWIFKYRHAS